MPLRVSDASSSARRAAQIAASRARVDTAQERLTSGKRINRPSDDPAGAAAVIRLRTSQGAIEQFRRNADAANATLLVGDGVLETYQQTLDRAHGLLTQGTSDFSDANKRQVLAAEIDGLRERILSIANTRDGDQYTFGGTRQSAPPYNPVTAAPATSPTSQQILRLEPDATPVATGVTAETVFADNNGTIFETLTVAATALRGTTDPAVDRAALVTAMNRIKTFIDQASVARTKIGVSLKNVEGAGERLGRDSLLLEADVQRVEGVDFAESALQFTEAERALEAALQISARTGGRRSLLDFLG